MTFPLQVLAVGAIIAGFVGVPAALGGGNAIEHFLEPSFVARAVVAEHATAPATARRARAERARQPRRAKATQSASSPKLPASTPKAPPAAKAEPTCPGPASWA